MIARNAFRAAAWKAREVIRHILIPQVEAASFPVDRPIHNGFLDYLKIDPSGIINVSGWSTSAFEAGDAPAIFLDGEAIPFLRHFRMRRPDIATATNSLCSQTGLGLDYLVPESTIGRNCKVISLQLRTGEVMDFAIHSRFLNPDYRSLLYSSEVIHREHIYSSGLPNLVTDPHIVELARHLKGPVLDFGCGRGALIAKLQRAGIEVYGLEMGSDAIRQAIPVGRSHLITLYDGSLPTPFPDGRFRSVVCSEVLEHISDYQAAIRDIARIASEEVLFTVPNASAIPIGFRHGSVPWHLMEATHVNFFTQESLEHALTPYFSQIEFGRIGRAHFNDSEYYVSLVAVCKK